MSDSTLATSRVSSTGTPAGASAEEPAKPVAVVWCRQVDNEAESPGYTTVPAEFPGAAEALEAIRAVGHLTVNVADTHDYWDPDPTQTLAYYPNLFLYPAWHGQYTCIGRMFLSKEDRPRLGMKTLVLATSDLLRGDDYGASVLRWFGSMGGPRRDAGRPGAPPESQLYDLVAEGFLFHLGSTDPVLLIGAERWERAMHVVLEMIRSLPSSLVALTTVLAFPYFLPSSQAELKSFQSKVPISLALMRVPNSESEGDRHEKRVQSWEAGATTVRDLAGDALPGDTSKGAVGSPLVVRYIRDRDEERLATLRNRVDTVELPGLRTRLTEPELQDGRKRRKEAWRIGTAMENAALLLARPRGRQLSMTSDVAKRARQYLDVGARRLPPPITAAPGSRPSLPAVAPAEPVPPEGVAAPSHPTETVPVPRRVDPTRSRSASPVAGLSGSVPGDLSVLDERAVRRIVEQEIDRRGGLPSAPRQALAGEITRSITLGVAAAREQLEQQFAARLQRVEDRLQRMGGGRSDRPTGGSPSLERALADLEERFRQFSESTRSAIGAEVTRQFQGLAGTEAQARGSLESRLSTAVQTSGQEVRAWVERLREEQVGKLPVLVQQEVERLHAESTTPAVAAIEARLQQQVDRQVSESIAAEEAKLVELMNRIRKILDQQPVHPANTAEFERVLAERVDEVVAGTLVERIEAASSDLRSTIEGVRSDQSDALERIQQLDRRTQVLVDRLVPVVRKAWLKIAEIERSPSGTSGPDVGLVELRREVQTETHRVEAEMQRRINDLRHHMETALGHQSRVWLTLIQQLSQLTSDRYDASVEGAKDESERVWEEPGPDGEGPAPPASPPREARAAADDRPSTRSRPKPEAEP